MPPYFLGMSIFLDKEERLDVVLGGIEKEHVYVENRVRSCALAMRAFVLRTGTRKNQGYL
jgi:hypothetical protein